MSKNPTVALLVTCLVDKLLPDVGIATVKLLRRAGFDVDFPEAQTCCGQPFYNSGFREEARRLAMRTIEIFEPYEAVVLPSGSCTTMIRIEYPHLFEDDPAWLPRAKALARKTFEFSEFLHQHNALPGTATSTNSAPLTYHDSCHMCRSLNLKKEPRELLAQCGMVIKEMPESDRCCGFGGLFSFKMPEVSAAITQQKISEAAEAGAEILVTADPGCLIQMREATPNASLRIEHISVILEEQTR